MEKICSLNVDGMDFEIWFYDAKFRVCLPPINIYGSWEFGYINKLLEDSNYDMPTRTCTCTNCFYFMHHLDIFHKVITQFNKLKAFA